MSGSLFDFGLYAFHNARALLDKGSGAYFYLPKLQNAEEAKLWADVNKFTEQKLEIPKGSIKCTVLIEHLLAAFQMDEIIYALKDNIIGLKHDERVNEHVLNLVRLDKEREANDGHDGMIIRSGSVVNKVQQASDLLEKFVFEKQMSDLLTLDAYDQLISDGK